MAPGTAHQHSSTVNDAARQIGLNSAPDTRSGRGELARERHRDATVLIVDPGVSDAEILRSFAARLGFAARVFGSCAELLQALPPPAGRACIVSEMLLPDTDGLGLLRALRERGISLPVVFLTRDRDLHHAVAAIRAGALDYQMKPLVEQRLAGKLVDALARGSRANAPASSPAPSTSGPGRQGSGPPSSP